MDPLDELKSLLNIPEGMNSHRARYKALEANCKFEGSADASFEEAVYGALDDAWAAIEAYCLIVEELEAEGAEHA